MLSCAAANDAPASQWRRVPFDTAGQILHAAIHGITFVKARQSIPGRAWVRTLSIAMCVTVHTFAPVNLTFVTSTGKWKCPMSDIYVYHFYPFIDGKLGA